LKEFLEKRDFLITVNFFLLEIHPKFLEIPVNSWKFLEIHIEYILKFWWEKNGKRVEKEWKYRGLIKNVFLTLAFSSFVNGISIEGESYLIPINNI
jgi:hypothetical protein